MYSSSQIPWDEVGPGWFLLDYDPADVRQPWPGEGPQPAVADTLTLISPDGALYAAGDIASAQATELAGWVGEELYLYRATDSHIWWMTGDEITFDMIDGTSVVTRMGTEFWGAVRPTALTPAADGYAVRRGTTQEESGTLRAYRDGTFSHVVAEDAFSDLSPDGTGVVSFVGRDDGTTDVFFNAVDGTRTHLQVLTLPGGGGSEFRGWLSNDVVLLTRTTILEGPTEMSNSVGNAVAYGPTLVFALDTRTGDATEYSLPFDTDQGDWLYSPDLSAFVYRAYGGGSDVVFYSLDGDVLTSVPCEHCHAVISSGVAISGDRAVVFDLSRTPLEMGGEPGPQHAVVTLVWPAERRTTVIADITSEVGVVQTVFGHPNVY